MSSSRTESGEPLGGDHGKTISSGFWQVSLSFPATPDVLQVPPRSSMGLQGSVIICKCQGTFCFDIIATADWEQFQCLFVRCW